MKKYQKPDIFIEEVSLIQNVCYVSRTNSPLQSFEDDGYGIFEDFSDI